MRDLMVWNGYTPREILLVLVFMIILPGGVFAETDTAATVDARYPGLASGILGAARLEPMEKNTILVAGSVKISLADINAAIKDEDPKLRRQLEKNLFFILEQEAVTRILLSEAQKTGISKKGKDKEEVVRSFLEHKAGIVSVSEEETRNFYDSNREMMGGTPFEGVRDGIQEYLRRGKKQTAINSYVDSLRNSVPMRINENWVKLQSSLALDNPVDKARSSRKPTMVEFGATGCIPCDMMQPILDNLRKNYPDRLNVVFVHVGEEQLLAARYGIRSIPVQVFFDAEGKEMFRHTGFYSEKEVIAQLGKIGLQ